MLKDGVCPLSKAPPCSELLAIADPDAAKTEINTIKEQIKILSDNITALKDMLTASEAAYKQYVANDAEQAVLKARIGTVPADIKDYDPADDRKALEQASELDIKSDIVKLSDKLEKQKTELLRINEKLNNPNAKTPEEKQQAKVLYEKRIDLANKIAGIDAELSMVSNNIDTTESMLTRMLEDKEKAEESNFKRTVYTLTRQVLSRDYLPRMLMENAIKQLNAHMLYYINLFNFPYTCQVFPDGSFMYSDDQGEWHHTKLLSGGQKYLVSIVLKLASAATLKTNFPFYVLDEPTTGLDTENRRLLADLFKDMEAKIHPLYLIIPTHDTEIADVASNVIDLRKEN
jgi:DNA repair exonuclease SbcCD ATPase subunit